ncbi:hypothetical protein [Paenibacillus sp. MER 78]|uniref:hypothetical protein n=1 Tax=Paenibacillus sp. MER 78 TaxID=2939571 RepID=UPI00203B05B7|nr:hypothetical protein [Paenibacillus sp. MER 78]MCM3128119.1 hypothetical protein [Paenibacillus sp. MER 78]
MIQTISCEINRAEYTVDLIYLRDIISGIIQEGEGIREELNQIVKRYGVQVDLRSTEDVTRFIKYVLKAEVVKERKLTNEALDRWFEQTRDVFFIKLKQYRRCRERYQKIAKFIKTLTVALDEWSKNSVEVFINSSLKKTTVKPVSTVNKNGGVSISQPALPFSITEVVGLLNFNVAIHFKSNDEMVSFLNMYGDIIWEDGMGKHLLVSGEVLYAQMIVSEYEIIPFSNSEDNMKRLIEQFNLEYSNPLEISTKIIIKNKNSSPL